MNMKKLPRHPGLVDEKETIIAKDGGQPADLMPYPDEREAMLRSLRGILPPTVTLEEAREARLAKHERHL